MKKNINKWLYFELLYYKDEFQRIDNLDSVHPEDREFVKNNLTNRIYHCIGMEGEYLIAKSKKYTIRVKPNVIKGYLPTPKFTWEDIVYEKGKPNETATINDFFWHHSKEQYLFYVSVNGKKKSKQLSENDLSKSRW